jgi:hypothetical protein
MADPTEILWRVRYARTGSCRKQAFAASHVLIDRFYRPMWVLLDCAIQLMDHKKPDIEMIQLLPSRSERASSTISGSSLAVILLVSGIVAALYLGREVLVPIALALLLSFVLAPLVRRLQAWRFPRILAVSIVAIFAFAIIFGLGAFMGVAGFPTCK